MIFRYLQNGNFDEFLFINRTFIALKLMSAWIFRFTRYLSSSREHSHLTTHSVSWFHEKSSFHQLKIESFQRKIEFFFNMDKTRTYHRKSIHRLFMIIELWFYRIYFLFFFGFEAALTFSANVFVKEVPIFYCDIFRWIITY